MEKYSVAEGASGKKNFFSMARIQVIWAENSPHSAAPAVEPALWRRRTHLKALDGQKIVGSWQGPNTCKKCTDRVFRKTLLPHCHRPWQSTGGPRFASVDAGDIAGSATTRGSQIPAR